jgi:hypothetical protein
MCLVVNGIPRKDSGDAADLCGWAWLPGLPVPPSDKIDRSYRPLNPSAP